MSSQCSRCVFEFPDARGRACVAFPTAIPAEIIDGRFDYTEAYVGDGGIRFVPRSESKRGTPASSRHAISPSMIASLTFRLASPAHS